MNRVSVQHNSLQQRRWVSLERLEIIAVFISVLLAVIEFIMW